jgi:hypothetical protein
LFGRDFELLGTRHNWGADQAYFRDPSGHLRLIPIAWTSLNPVDPAILFSDGRAPFRLLDLIELARLIDTLSDADQPTAPASASTDGGSHV